MFSVALLVTIFVGDRVLAICLQSLLLHSQFRFSMLYRGNQSNDVLIIGDSRGVNSFYAPDVEKALGMKVLNLSYNGMSGEIAEVLLLDYLKMNQPPKKLIIEASFSRGDEKLANDLKLYCGVSERVKLLCRNALPESSFWLDVLHLFRFNGEMFLRVLYYLNRTDQNWINRHVISAELLAAIEGEQSREMEMRAETARAVTRMVKAARDTGMDVTLIISPYAPKYAAKISNLHDYKHSIQLSTGISVWDFSSAIADAACFSDRLHLNYKGSRMLLDILVEKHFFSEETSSLLSHDTSIVPKNPQRRQT